MKKKKILAAILATTLMLGTVGFSGCWETEDKGFLDNVKGWFDKTEEETGETPDNGAGDNTGGETPDNGTQDDGATETPDDGKIMLRLDPTYETVRLTYGVVSESGQEYEYSCIGKVDRKYPPTLHFFAYSEELSREIGTTLVCSSQLTDNLCEYVIARDATEFCVDDNNEQWYLYVKAATVLDLT